MASDGDAERGAFEPIAAVARWEVLIGYMEGVEDGVVVKNDELGAVLLCAPDRVSSEVTKANAHLADEGLRLVAEDKGYRWARPEDALHESTGVRARKAVRNARRGFQAARAAGRHRDADSLTTKRATDAQVHWAAVERAMRTDSRKLRRLGPELPVVRKSSEM